MSNCSKRRREGTKPRIRTLGNHEEFLRRITKSLYYGELPDLPCLSLPVTELSADLFSAVHRGRSLKRLHLYDAAEITRNACVSPCSLILAILYLERLRTCNPEYLAKMAPSEVFLISLMVSNKFLQDDGEEDEVFADEWAISGGIEVETLKQLERDFLEAIDWRVYISEANFEEGLTKLEHQVALKQVQRHGFCTYSDLSILSKHINFTNLLKTFTTASLAITLGYITSLLTVVTSSILISNLCMPKVQNESLSSSIVSESQHYELPIFDVRNETDDVLDVETNVKCCPEWFQHNETPKKIVTISSKFEMFLDLKDYETWWPKVPTMNWLYQNSLISPFQKWYDELFQLDILNLTNEPMKKENSYGTDNNWFDLNKLGPLIISINDR